MKKLIVLLFSTLIATFSLFAGVMNNRFVELRINTPVDISNNTFQILDLFQNEELLIDLGAVADSVPKNGFTLASNTNPTLGLNVNAGKLHLGVNIGGDFYGSLNLNKSLFEFLGYGYEYGNELSVSPALYGELFLTGEVNADLQIGSLKINVNPALFVPVGSINSGNTYFTFENTEDGDLNIAMNGDIELYSQFAADDSDFGLDFESVTSNGTNVSLESQEGLMKLFTQSGFDLAGTVELPPMLLNSLSFSVYARCPIVPGKLSTKTSISASKTYTQSIPELAENYINNANSSETEESEETSEEDQSESIFDMFDLKYTSEEVVYKIHRPLKFMGYASYHPLGNLLSIKAGLGFGLRSPFTEAAQFFPEYYLGGNASVLGGFLTASVSTEYKNEIFIHQGTLGISLRAFEFDFGLGAEGSDLESSFGLSGLRAYVGVAVGI